MTFIIEGKVQVRERPDRYLLKYLAVGEHRSPHTFPEPAPVVERTSLDGLTRNFETFREQREISVTRDGTMHNSSIHIVASPADALELKRAGYTVRQITSKDAALELCKKREVSVSARRFIQPSSWTDYIWSSCAQFKDHETLSGKVLVWNVTRFPLPILSIASRGHLERVFTVFPDGVAGPAFEYYEGSTRVETEIQGTGTYRSTGPVLDIGFVRLSWENVRTKTSLVTNTKRYRR